MDKWCHINDDLEFYPFDDKSNCKRVIGLPKDRIPDHHLENLPMDKWCHINGKVPPGKMWIEGDNDYDPSKFQDSRKYGPVPIGLMQGVVFCRVWPSLKWRGSWINDLRNCDASN